MGAELMRERKEGEMVSSNNSNIPTFLVFPSLCGHDHKGHQHHDEGGKQATHSEKHRIISCCRAKLQFSVTEQFLS